jgi:gamma-glutamylcyclotransferase (GGCT)/AIG2-like uncharacterized protein YtfP
MSDALFTYGTLQIPEVIEAVAGRVLSSVEANAPGFAQFRFTDRIYPGMVLREGGVTEGRVYFDVSDRAWYLLDSFEDPIYERQVVEVHLTDGARVNAQAYVLPGALAHLLSSEPWTIEWFSAQHLEGYVSRCQLFFHMMTQA